MGEPGGHVIDLSLFTALVSTGIEVTGIAAPVRIRLGILNDVWS